MDKYGELFFDYVDIGAICSANVFVELLMPELGVRSLLDVGCGRGGWASRWKAGGCEVVLGLDGDYVDTSKLYIAQDEFRTTNLNRSFDVGRRFDLVQSLEVAEHLEPESSETFVASLVRHGDVIFFSAAVPGQGGTQHINERPLEFWRKLFAQHGYMSFDFLRPITRTDRRVEPFYRFNSLLYASNAGRSRLSETVRRSEVPLDQPLRQFATPAWRLRCAVLKALPVSIIDRMAVINARMRMAGRGLKSEWRPGTRQDQCRNIE